MLIAIRPNCVCVTKKELGMHKSIYFLFYDFRTEKFYHKNLSGLSTVRKIAIVCNFYNMCPTFEKFSYIYKLWINNNQYNISAYIMALDKICDCHFIKNTASGFNQFLCILNDKYLNVYCILHQLYSIFYVFVWMWVC